MLLELTTEQFETIKNMVDFSTSHAADGLSPALSEDFIEDAKDTAEYFERYAIQEEKVCSARKLLGLEELGDYAEHSSHYILQEKKNNN